MTPTTRDTREPGDPAVSEAEGALARAVREERRSHKVTYYSTPEKYAAAILAALSADGWRVEREGLREAAQEVADLLSNEQLAWGEYPALDAAHERMLVALRGGPDATD